MPATNPAKKVKNIILTPYAERSFVASVCSLLKLLTACSCRFSVRMVLE